MFSRLAIPALIAAAAGGPYVASETEFGRSLMSSLGTSTQSDLTYVGVDVSDLTRDAYANHAHHEVEKLRRNQPERYLYEEMLTRKLGGIPQEPAAAPKLVGTQISDLREVLRFDISPKWVIQRFARVTTVLADLRLEGVRIPIVTGTQASDVAGTLTYYFDSADKLQRITVHGFTGDPDRLIGVMTQSYGLKQEPSLEAGVFTKRWNGRPTDFFRLTHAPVVHSNAIHHKYTVFLELNHPDLSFGISQEARRIVESDRQSGRW